MYPILFTGTEYKHYPAIAGLAVAGLSIVGDNTAMLGPFTSQGLGTLSDCISCVVTEERNGMYELEMQYPISGAHFEDIQWRYFILAKPNYYDDPQPFRIYKITKPLNGICTIYAQHISYDLSGMECPAGISATSVTEAFTKLNLYANYFTLSTELSGGAEFSTDVPASVRSWFGGKEGSLIDLYGGEWKYDLYSCKLMSARGLNRGVTIRYGKNLTTLEQEEECSNLCTAVRAFYQDSSSGNVYTSDLISTGITLEPDKVLILDANEYFDEIPTTAQLNARAAAYINENNLRTPKVNLELDFVQMQYLDRVDLCDTVTVIFEELGVNATAKCIRTEWDVLKDRYQSITLGDAKSSFAETIEGVSQKVAEKAVKKSSNDYIEAINNATQLITGNKGGYVVIHDSDDDSYPDEILIMNEPAIEDATKVWRWNKNGLGYSSTGYEGTYGLAMTADGAIVADFITTGTMSANRIKGGTLTLGGNSNGNGLLEVYNASNTLVARMNNAGLYAIAGTIGGFTITSTALYTDSLTSTSGGAIGLSTADFTRTIGGTSRSGLRLAIGSNFAVSNAGALYASSGVIGGFTIDSSSIRSAALTSNASGSVGISTANFTRTINSVSRSGLRLAIGSNFGVSDTGVLYASNAIVSGNITAITGAIANWVISGDYMITTNDSIGLQAFIHRPTAVGGGDGTGNTDVLVIRNGSGTSADPYSWPFALYSNGNIIMKQTNSSGAYFQGELNSSKFIISAVDTSNVFHESRYISDYLEFYYAGSFRAQYGRNGMFLSNNNGSSYTIQCSATSGNITCVSLTQTSDRQLKQEIETLDEQQATEFIYNLRPVSYKLKNAPEKLRHGFIAQEVEEIIDSHWGIVSDGYEEIEEIDTPQEHYKSLAYTEIIADLVATVQSLNERIKVLEAK